MKMRATSPLDLGARNPRFDTVPSRSLNDLKRRIGYCGFQLIGKLQSIYISQNY